MQRYVMIGSIALALMGCSSPSILPTELGSDVQIRIDSQFNPDQCEYLGEVTGSEGHWYSYLFYTNDAMMHGAMVDLKNNAVLLNADTVYMISPQDFATSFSVLGTAYRCQ
ncbi:DUF4156 domain-containing protein [Vibrio campbellii]|uniref:DUF4156 domain-containing protein n=1 Tax=Vibrio campbellii (strain ATCC BAA-1116) TaxID=2902295 RepID=A7MY48_VIBC1|nr:DUF4156 domain-containing protein [Vibrio campbellii]ABU72129.1 hypothetical protein VIBHAR_03180 [Vibrio campbellii ATCC BAA-1116]AGU95593.1 membrane protein [Vibrio campbellii ATCC BAA-1116]MBT0123854.1 DUF4156 domain-containing protein [Vibrio campbellii]MBT0138823.1 DUF4156 domain-containing protein [Vibrio campbellii]MBT0143505.1 DUF4156 domain-containing protein [Vibrio campbellii]